jgi:hypothetical protein
LLDFYKNIYQLSPRLPKRDRFGICLRLEGIALESIELAVGASLEQKQEKLPKLKLLRNKIEVIKRLVRLCHELKLIKNSVYVSLSTKLQEASKMVNGWIKFLS